MNLRLFTCCICLFISFSISAQNWQLFSSQDIAHYKNLGSDVFDYSIWVDSIQTQGNDSIYYFNKVDRYCESCGDVVNPCGNFYSFEINLEQSPLFFKTMKKVDMNTYYLSGAEDWLIQPQASLGDNWTAVMTNGITAMVDSVYSASIFGTLDSLKRIAFSNGDQLILSKNHGMVAIPSSSNLVNLVALENRQLGEAPPSMADFYNFDIGDVFQYDFYRNSSSNQDFRWGKRKVTVLDKTQIGDTLRYKVYQIKREYIQNYGAFLWVDSSTFNMDIILEESHPSNLNQNQRYYFPGSISDCNYDFDNPVSSFAHHYIDEEGLYSKDIGIQTQLADGYTCCFYQDTSDNESIISLEPAITYELDQLVYKEGLGLTLTSMSQFEFGYQERLEGYVKNGDTTGTVFPDLFLLVDTDNPNPQDIDLELRIAPNPAFDYVNLTLETSHYSTPFHLELYNIMGQSILTQPIPSNQEIQLSRGALFSGVYFVLIRSESGEIVARKKIVFQ